MKQKPVSTIKYPEMKEFRTLRPLCKYQVSRVDCEFMHQPWNILWPVFPIRIHNDDASIDTIAVCIRKTNRNRSLVAKIPGKVKHMEMLDLFGCQLSKSMQRAWLARVIIHNEDIEDIAFLEEYRLHLAQQMEQGFPIIEQWYYYQGFNWT